MPTQAQLDAIKRHKERLKLFKLIEVRLVIPESDVDDFKDRAQRARKRVGYFPLPAGRGGQGEE